MPLPAFWPLGTPGVAGLSSLSFWLGLEGVVEPFEEDPRSELDDRGELGVPGTAPGWSTK